MIFDETGEGYATPPKVTVKGFEKTEFVATLPFDKNLKKSGSIEVKK